MFAEALVHSVVNKEHVYVNGNYNMDTMQMSCLLDFWRSEILIECAPHENIK